MRWLKDILKNKTVVLDANAILRYLLKDIEEQYNEMCDLIASEKCTMLVRL